MRAWESNIGNIFSVYSMVASGTPSARKILHNEPAWVPEDASSTGEKSKKAIATCSARLWGVINKMQKLNLFTDFVCRVTKYCKMQCSLLASSKSSFLIHERIFKVGITMHQFLQ